MKRGPAMGRIDRGGARGVEPYDDWASERSMEQRGRRLREMAPDDLPDYEADRRPY